MARFVPALIAALLLLAPVYDARADFILEGSFGAGFEVSPNVEQRALNVMVTPGYTLLSDILRLELGLVADFGAVRDLEFDIAFRPMVVIDPPALPLYLRGIFALQNLLGPGDVILAYGAALGLGFDVAGVGLFVEAGVLPQSEASQMVWLLEGRAGLYYIF